MPVYGDLGTMRLTDLLQWVGMSQQTGVLELERNGVTKRIEFRKGFISSCYSSDRPNQLGQFLLARGKVTQEQLDALFEDQRNEGKRLGWMLVESELMTEQEVARSIAANIEETIQVLFDWRDAAFRFFQGATMDPQQIEVSLTVHDVLMRGIQFQDELKRFREIFPSSGVVLRRTDRPAPDELVKPGISRRIFESIDGRRTIAEVLRDSRASEQLVLKLLFRLHQLALVDIADTRPIESTGQTLLDPLPREDVRDDGSNYPAGSAAGLALADDLSVESEAARRLLKRGEYPAAVELLNASFRAQPGNYELGCLLNVAEAGFVTSARGAGALEPTAVPVRIEAVPGQDLEAEETFLLRLIDGRFDVQSILSLATMREEDVLLTLERMLEKGLIVLHDDQAAGSTATLD